MFLKLEKKINLSDQKGGIFDRTGGKYDASLT